jgi:hypothetical protein
MVAMKSIRMKSFNWNRWIAVVLVLVNAYMWVIAIQSAFKPYVVDPIRDPEVVALLDYIQSGEHSGESWQINLTELEAEQTITWYLKKYPQIPFEHPNLTITPDYVSGEGDVTITGVRIHVSGKASVTLKDGLPVVKILEMNLPLPASIRNSIEREIQVQLRRADLLPVRFKSADWGDGVVLVKGTIR